MFSRPCGWSHRGIARSRALPFPPASPRSRAARSLLGVAAALVASGLAHGALSTSGSITTIASPMTPPSAVAAMHVATGMLGDELLARASQLGSCSDFDACALLLGTAECASACRELTDATKTPGLGAWNCDEREHFRAGAAMRSDLDDGARSGGPSESMNPVAPRAMRTSAASITMR